MPNALQMSDKQNEYIRNAKARFNFKVGAVRSGKSFVDTAYIVPMRIRERAKKPGLNLILGVSRESIERNVLEPMREIYTDRLVGPIKTGSNIAMICGEPTYCLGAEKISNVAKIQGMSVKYCYGDEVAKWHRAVFEMLKSRLDKEYSCMDGACNPEGPQHWFKKDFLDKEGLDLYVQKYRIFDNPFLPASFIENLMKEYAGTVYFDRYIEGEWKQAEGLIFPHYEDAIGDCPFVLPNKILKLSDFQLSIDYGTMNAFACLLWVKTGNVWWAWRGYYYSGRETGIQLTDSEYADAVTDLIMPVLIAYSNSAGERAVTEKMKTIIDPSAASFIAELNKRKFFKILKAKNNVGDGIRHTNTAIRHGLIKVDRSLKEWADEAGGYIWDEKAEEDTPVKVNDHYMDSTRYFVETNDLTRNIDKILNQENYNRIMGGQRTPAALGYF